MTTDEPRPATEPRWPAPGGYAIPDPHSPTLVSYWVIHTVGARPEPWPSHTSRYGPPKPPRAIPGRTKEQRRADRLVWEFDVAMYRRSVLEAILADPVEARALFAANTDRCPRCVSQVSVTNLPDNAAWSRPTGKPE